MESKNTPILEVHDLVIRRNSKTVLDIDHFEVEQGETLAIIGPNGAGKSTLLLALAGLIKPSQGQIFFMQQDLDHWDSLQYRRKISLVLQDPLLLDTAVYNNVATGLRMRRLSGKVVKTKVQYWLSRFGISHLMDRPAKQLSGGEAQRVSLARSFCLNPLILFLDEPFSALDAPTRTRLLEDFKTLLNETAMTVILVTHDMNEALLLGDRMLVLVDGQLRQVGTPEIIFSSPADMDVAELVGVETVMSGRVVNSTDGQVVVDVCGIPIEAVGTAYQGQEMLLLLRPEDVTLWKGATLPISSARNILTGQVIRMNPQGPLTRVVVQCEGMKPDQSIQVIALITRTSGFRMGLKENVRVSVTFKASAIHMIPRS